MKSLCAFSFARMTLSNEMVIAAGVQCYIKIVYGQSSKFMFCTQEIANEDGWPCRLVKYE